MLRVLCVGLSVMYDAYGTHGGCVVCMVYGVCMLGILGYVCVTWGMHVMSVVYGM